MSRAPSNSTYAINTTSTKLRTRTSQVLGLQLRKTRALVVLHGKAIYRRCCRYYRYECRLSCCARSSVSMTSQNLSAERTWLCSCLRRYSPRLSVMIRYSAVELISLVTSPRSPTSRSFLQTKRALTPGWHFSKHSQIVSSCSRLTTSVVLGYSPRSKSPLATISSSLHNREV